jgi:hypothetical protein
MTASEDAVGDILQQTSMELHLTVSSTVLISFLFKFV